MKKRYIFLLLVVAFAFSFWKLLSDKPSLNKAPVNIGYEPAWTQPDECQVDEIKKLGEGGSGIAWSPTENNLVVSAKFDAAKIMQIYKKRINSSEEVCLSCKLKPRMPPVNAHKGAVSFHPDGKHLILQVEMAEHPLKGKLGHPGPGWFNNVWMTTINGDKWWQLTDYPHGSDDPYHGVLIPRISHDGKKVAWAQLYKGPGPIFALLDKLGLYSRNPWGYWQLNIADLIFDEKGFRLEDIKSFRPGNGNWYETQGWSADDKEILFAADIGENRPQKSHIWKMNVTSGEISRLTDNKASFEEFADFSPDGKKIVYMSTEGFKVDLDGPLWGFLAEYYLVNADGSNKVQLTHFNTPGYSEFLPGRNVVTEVHWHPKGTKLILTNNNVSSDLKKVTSSYWLLTFEGACGRL